MDRDTRTISLSLIQTNFISRNTCVISGIVNDTHAIDPGIVSIR
jgi:hypothetical protein